MSKKTKRKTYFTNEEIYQLKEELKQLKLKEDIAIMNNDRKIIARIDILETILKVGRKTYIKSNTKLLLKKPNCFKPFQSGKFSPK